MMCILFRYFCFASFILSIAACERALEPGSIIAETQIFDDRVQPTNPDFLPLALNHARNAIYLTKLGGIYIQPTTENPSIDTLPTLIHQFDDTVRGIIQTPRGTLIVSTDHHHKEAITPNILWRSDDGGKTFTKTLTITGGTVFHWSFATTKDGILFAGEYGPQQAAYSKTLWRSEDDGRSWHSVYEAPSVDGTHIHRVEVDPFTDDIWFSQGDDEYAELYRSQDRGNQWQLIAKSQATDFAFTADALYLGEDTQRFARIGRIDRHSLKYDENWFRGDKIGNYSGSVYAIAHDDNNLYVANMKYPSEDHIAALIEVPFDKGDQEPRPLAHFSSIAGTGAGLSISVGPACNGVIYWPGYSLKAADNTCE